MRSAPPCSPPVALALSVRLAGCSTTAAGGGPAATPAARADRGARQRSGQPGGRRPATDWTTYHRDAARTGVAPASPAAGPLAIAWRRHLDGAVYGQPLVVGGLVIAATEGDTVYGLDRATGQVRWHVSLGTPVPLSALPCGDIDPLGITGTPVYDPATGLVYAVAETTGFHHILAGIAVPSGKLLFQRDVPTPDGHPRDDQQRAALALDRRPGLRGVRRAGRRLRPLPGSVNGIPATRARADGVLPGADGQGRRHVGGGRPGGRPVRHHLRQRGQRGGHRPALGRQRLGHRAHPRPAPHRDLRPAHLARGQRQRPRSGVLSAPRLLSDGSMLTVGKRGTGYLLNASHLTGVGSQVAQAPVCPAYGGMAVAGQVVYVPCEGGGMAAVDTSGNKITVLWRGPPRPRARRCSAAARSGSPTGTPGCCTSSIPAPATSGTRSGWARRCRTSPRRPCPARSP